MIKNKFKNIDNIFSISTESEFEEMALEIFNFQYKENKVYRQYCDYLNVSIEQIKNVKQIPFLPISFFKTHEVITGEKIVEKEFTSSGTTGMITSSHFVKDIGVYHIICIIHKSLQVQ